MAQPQRTTLREEFAWCYANLARAHAALEDGVSTYQRRHHVVRNRIYHGRAKGSLNCRTLFDDERERLILGAGCSYCCSGDSLALDHLLPRRLGGEDQPENLVVACRTCNASKGGKDLVQWHLERGSWPPLLTLRRYLKLVLRTCQEQGILDLPLEKTHDLPLPFDPLSLRAPFPPLEKLVLRPTANRPGHQ